MSESGSRVRQVLCSGIKDFMASPAALTANASGVRAHINECAQCCGLLDAKAEGELDFILELFLNEGTIGPISGQFRATRNRLRSKLTAFALIVELEGATTEEEREAVLTRGRQLEDAAARMLFATAVGRGTQARKRRPSERLQRVEMEVVESV